MMNAVDMISAARSKIASIRRSRKGDSVYDDPDDLCSAGTQRLEGPGSSDPVYEVADGNVHRLGNPGQTVDRNVLLAPLQAADVNGVKVSLFGQLFLTPAEPLPVSANVLAESPPVLRG